VENAPTQLQRGDSHAPTHLQRGDSHAPTHLQRGGSYCLHYIQKQLGTTRKRSKCSLCCVLRVAANSDPVCYSDRVSFRESFSKNYPPFHGRKTSPCFSQELITESYSSQLTPIHTPTPCISLCASSSLLSSRLTKWFRTDSASFSGYSVPRQFRHPSLNPS
jgi:hypothetical protein